MSAQATQLVFAHARNRNRTRRQTREIVQNRDDEFLAETRHDNFEKPDESTRCHLTDGPVSISSAVLMGTMPSTDKLIKSGTLQKLTPLYEWKEMTVALTSVGLFFARPGEEALRDLLPLFDVVDVKKRHDTPGDASKGGEKRRSPSLPSARNVKMSNLISAEVTDADLHIIQVRTVENGYNSGRTYYLRADSEETCNDWVQQLRTASDRAVMLKKAGPSLFRRIRFGRTHTFVQMHALTTHYANANAYSRTYASPTDHEKAIGRPDGEPAQACKCKGGL